MPGANGRSELAGDALWRFSLAFYARPGVAEALLALQDRAGRDVNLTLVALWLGATQGRLLDIADLAAAEAAIAPVAGAVVAPLRALRRQIRGRPEGDVAALRRRVAALELAAERRVQDRLAACFADRPGAAPDADPLAAAQANLALYLGDAVGSPEAGALCRAIADLMRRPAAERR